MFESNPVGVRLYAFDSPDIPNTNESMASIMEAMTKYLPGLMTVTNQEMIPSEQAKLAASQAVSPGYLSLQDALFRQYGPSLAQTGSDIAKQNALAQAQQDLAVVSGPGRELVKEALKTQKEADPEYYALRESLGRGYGSLIDALNPSGLSAGETEAAQREINRQNVNRGTAGNPSQISTVSNAMQFGNKLAEKQDRIANIFSAGAGMLNPLKSGTDVFQVATGKPSTTNTGDNKYINPTQNAGQDAIGMSSNLLNSATGVQNTYSSLKSKEKDTMDKLQQGIGITKSLFGGLF